MGSNPAAVPCGLEEILHLLEAEVVLRLGQLHTAGPAEMALEGVWDLEELPEEEEEGPLQVPSEVEEELVLAEDFVVVEVEDLVDNKLISYPSDIQVSSKL